MTTDPKKNDEVKDEDLELVSGGAGKDDIDQKLEISDLAPVSVSRPSKRRVERP